MKSFIQWGFLCSLVGLVVVLGRVVSLPTPEDCTLSSKWGMKGVWVGMGGVGEVGIGLGFSVWGWSMFWMVVRLCGPRRLGGELNWGTVGVGWGGMCLLESVGGGVNVVGGKVDNGFWMSVWGWYEELNLRVVPCALNRVRQNVLTKSGSRSETMNLGIPWRRQISMENQRARFGAVKLVGKAMRCAH